MLILILGKISFFFTALTSCPLQKDQIEKGNVEIEYCPTDEMTADFMTKALQGEKFIKFRKEIMNLDQGYGEPH